MPEASTLVDRLTALVGDMQCAADTTVPDGWTATIALKQDGPAEKPFSGALVVRVDNIDLDASGATEDTSWQTAGEELDAVLVFDLLLRGSMRQRMAFAGYVVEKLVGGIRRRLED